MKTNRIVSLLVLQGLLGMVALAAPFDCGSTGAYGAMNISNNTTLQLPTDGIFNCTTITVASGATLTFSKNSFNTPVYLLATGDVVINGTIDVSAIGRIGGPGGFDGGYGGMYFSTSPTAGDGYGPGGGKGSQAIGTFAGTYGNQLLVPLIGGSGAAGNDGSPGSPGGGGGGAVLIASNTKITVNGAVLAYGTVIHYTGSGCGGGIRLVAPLVGGGGGLRACGAEGNGPYGRIRIDCQDIQAYRSLSLSGNASRGSRMMVFPAVIPALDIIAVAGNAIPEGTNSPVFFELPVGASTNQTVLVQARNYSNDVPIRVVVTPENGPSGSFDTTILQSSGNPPSTNVPVIIPAGRVSQIIVWTR